MKSRHTKNCIVCFREARTWHGYVSKNKEKILAGWGKNHTHAKSMFPMGPINLIGFSGHWRKEMGIRDDA